MDHAVRCVLHGRLPKRLRLHTRFDRQLLGRLCARAWMCIKAEAQRILGRDDVLPGTIAVIQPHCELLHWHPHIHVLITCGAFTPEGDFLEVPEFDSDRLLAAWQEAVFALYLAEGKIESGTSVKGLVSRAKLWLSTLDPRP